MGRPFLDHLGGRHYYCCNQCKTYLTNKKEIISKAFRGSTGAAYLFHYVVNITVSQVEERVMITGHHFVRDVFCKCCMAKLGWMYEFARDPSQVYKEGNVILERKLLDEMEARGELANTDFERPLLRSPSETSMASQHSGSSTFTVT